jgi:hypothetical protein
MESKELYERLQDIHDDLLGKQGVKNAKLDDLLKETASAAGVTARTSSAGDLSSAPGTTSTASVSNDEKLATNAEDASGKGKIK